MVASVVVALGRAAAVGGGGPQPRTSMAEVHNDGVATEATDQYSREAGLYMQAETRSRLEYRPNEVLEAEFDLMFRKCDDKVTPDEFHGRTEVPDPLLRFNFGSTMVYCTAPQGEELSEGAVCGAGESGDPGKPDEDRPVVVAKKAYAGWPGDEHVAVRYGAAVGMLVPPTARQSIRCTDKSLCRFLCVLCRKCSSVRRSWRWRKVCCGRLRRGLSCNH